MSPFPKPLLPVCLHSHTFPAMKTHTALLWECGCPRGPLREPPCCGSSTPLLTLGKCSGHSLSRTHRESSRLPHLYCFYAGPGQSLSLSGPLFISQLSLLLPHNPDPHSSQNDLQKTHIRSCHIAYFKSFTGPHVDQGQNSSF